MTAKTEIADYSIATSFGRGRRIVHDRKWAEAQTRGEAIRQIEETYRANDWKAPESAANSRLLGLEVKPLAAYTNAELKIILDDLRKHRMILFEE